MGESKDITDQIYDILIDKLHEMGYEDISTNANNLIVDLIDVGREIEDLLAEAIKIIEHNQ